MKILIIFLFLFSFSSFSQDRDWYAYKQAVKKAFHFQKLKRPSVLFNVDETNSYLQVSCNPKWNCVGDKNNWDKNVRVRMVSWVSAGTANRFFSSYVGGARPYNTGNKFLWVSAFPQVQNFCQKVETEDIRLRLKQYMGFPPNANKTHFVHVWVRPSDLFRPCYDEEVSDTKCEYSFPDKISSRHNKWVRDQLIAAYPKSGMRYPWTRLGYTFDWGNPKSYFGASEYVIKAHADIFIETITPTGIYCTK